MNILGGFGVGIIALVALGFILIAAVIVFIILRTWIKVARADEALVVSGKKSSSSGGENVTVIVNGRAVVNPMLQRHEIISLRSRQVSMKAEAQSLDGVTLVVDAVAIVKIHSTEESVRAAAQRFASQDKAIEVFTTEQLEGALRGVVATLPVVDLMRDRKKFADQIAQDISGELNAQGLHLDTFQIKGITDSSGYIASLGAPEIAVKRQAAEVAATNADRAVRKQQIENEEANLVEQTKFDRNEQNSAAEVGRARAEAQQAEALTHAEAEQKVLLQAAENKQASLDADVKRVADAERYRQEQVAEAKLFETQKAAEAQAFEKTRQAEAEARVAEEQAKAVKVRAEGEAQAERVRAEASAQATRVRALAEAESIQATGQARAASIEAEANALAQHQEALLAQRAIEALPLLMAEFAKGYANVGEITIVGGSDGTSASSFVAGEQATALRGLFDSVEAATGLDIAGIIQGRVQGEAIGKGIGSSTSVDNKQENDFNE